jgi:hypothetical protein
VRRARGLTKMRLRNAMQRWWRWACFQIIQMDADKVIRVEGVGKKRQALVQWRGFDRESDLQHQPSWRPVAHVTADLLQPFKRQRTRASGAGEEAPVAGTKRASSAVRVAASKRVSPGVCRRRLRGEQLIAGLGEGGGEGRGALRGAGDRRVGGATRLSCMYVRSAIHADGTKVSGPSVCCAPNPYGVKVLCGCPFRGAF